MARIWIEPYEDYVGSDAPKDYWHIERVHWRAPTLIAGNVLFVTVASFTFSFFSIEQIRDCLAYYQRKIRPSSRLPIPGDIDHWEAQRWFERLPMYLLEEPKRAKVIKALTRALALAESGVFAKRSLAAKKR
jgi:hypothetical protein